MFIPLHDQLVIMEYHHDLERKAEKERLFRSITVSPGRNRQSFSSLSKWLGARVSRLRCAIFPFNTAAVCTS